jgi:hypothetical protein
MSAASARASDLAERSTVLPALTAVLEQVVLADLADSVGVIMTRLQAEAARAPDIAHLMDGLPSLASVSRYGNVRRGDAGVIGAVVDGFVVRICVGLPAACARWTTTPRRRCAVASRRCTGRSPCCSAMITRRVARRDPADRRLGSGSWRRRGRCARLLLDAGALDHADAARHLSRTLSVAEDPARAAAWVEGFLAGSGQLLLHDDALWRLIDSWLVRLPEETFVALLPLLRRAFSAFTAPERRRLGDRARQPGAAVLTREEYADFDLPRAEAGLRTVLTLLGVTAR